MLRARSPTTETFRAWSGFVVIYAARGLFSLVMPWIPPKNGSTGSSGGWYATYCLAGVGIISVGVIYYFSWMWFLPRLGGYDIVQETVTLEGGAITNVFIKRARKREATITSRDDEDLAPLLNG